MRAITTLALLIAAPALAQQPSPAQPSSAQASLDAAIADFAQPEAPGCSVAADRRGQRIATGAFGLADLEHGVANTPDTIFEAGSVSKQFTAAAILLLAEDGRIALDDDIRTYLPEMPAYPTPVTIDQLISHTSGLRDWGALAMIGGWERGTRAYTNADVLRILARQTALNYPAGARYSYTNSGYNLMALIVERVTGQRFAAFTKARLFDPLGMASTRWRDDFRFVLKNRAVAYRPAQGGWEEHRPFEDTHGHGGLLTTVGDLLAWNRALAAGTLGERVTARLHERATLNDGFRIAYARGVVSGSYRGQPNWAHSGATAGYRAWLERFPASGLAVAVLCNGGSLNPAAVARRFLDSQLPPAPAPKPAAAAAPPIERAGDFVEGSTGRAIHLRVEDGKLRLDDGRALDDLGDGLFRAGETEVRFADADHFRRTTPEGHDDHVRAQPFLPDAAALAGYTGRYASDEAEAAFDVRPDGAGISLTLVDRPWQALQLSPVYPDAFQHGEWLARFHRDRDGRVRELSLGVSRVHDLRFKPVPVAK